MPTLVKFLDKEGASFALDHVGNKPQISSYPFLFDVADNNIPNHDTVLQQGYNAKVPGTEEDVWSGSIEYEYPVAATNLIVSSSSANDSSLSVGAATVKIFGLDSAYGEINESIVMDGQNRATTIREYLRVFRAVVTDLGTTNLATAANVGNINVGTPTITAGVPVKLYCQIPAGMNKSLMALWTVPLGKTFHLTKFFASSNVATDTDTEVFLRVRPYGEAFQVEKRFHLKAGANEFLFDMPLNIAARSDIACRASAIAVGAASLGVEAGFSGWYEG